MYPDLRDGVFSGRAGANREPFDRFDNAQDRQAQDKPMDEPKEKITLQRDGESILLRKRYVEQKVPLRPCCVRATAGQVRIHIPLKFKRRISTLLNTGGGRILLYEAMLRCEVRGEIIIRRRGYGGQVMPDGLPDFHPDRTAYQKPLVIALARAHRWQRLLDEGEVSSISELARRFKVDPSYVSRIMRLTLLAPDIVEAILKGREPSGLSLAKLTKIIPIHWKTQKAIIQFYSSGPP